MRIWARSGRKYADPQVGAERRLDPREVGRRRSARRRSPRSASGRRRRGARCPPRLGPGDVDAAGAAIAVVDPRLVAERGRPVGIEHRAPRAELDRSGWPRSRSVCRRDQPGAGPRGLAAELAAVEHRGQDPLASQDIGDRQPDHPAADDDDVAVRHGASDQWSRSSPARSARQGRGGDPVDAPPLAGEDQVASVPGDRLDAVGLEPDGRQQLPGVRRRPARPIDAGHLRTSRPPGAAVGRQVGPRGGLDEPGERAERPGQGGRRERRGGVERHGEQLGLASVERLGHDHRAAAVDEQALGVEPALGREPVIPARGQRRAGRRSRAPPESGSSTW